MFFYKGNCRKDDYHIGSVPALNNLDWRARVRDVRPSIEQHESMFRSVAVVLSSLPASAAARLLDNVDSQTRNAIHQAVATLPAIDPFERDQILDDFRESVQQAAQPFGDVQDEFVVGQSSIRSTSHAPARVASFGVASGTVGSEIDRHEPDNQSLSSESLFAFLDDVDADDLAKLLSGEHPQTIALVLASVSPKRAADVLPQLDADQQAETLSRIGRLEDVDDATLTDVCEHLQSRIQSEAQTNNHGKRALQAIIAQLPELGHRPKQHQSQTNAAQDSSRQQITGNSELRVAEGTWPTTVSETTGNEVEQPAHFSKDQYSKDQYSDDPGCDGTVLQVHHDDEFVDQASSGDGEAVHRYLVDLSPQTLVYALGLVSTRDALLTLCGLPNATAERAMALLPRSKAKQVRRSMASLEALQLREIDSAKQAVAEVARRTTDSSSMLSAA